MTFLIIFILLVQVQSIGLRGTWLSKSKSVITGYNIYDPVDELIFEPSLPGIAYSFDDEGNWEQAIYQVGSNPIRHECPTATIIWQHGRYEQLKDGSLVLTPYPSDGRQLFSDPCNNPEESIYMRYNEVEKISRYIIEWDGYNGKYKLQLYGFDGSKQQPLWLEYDPPMMLPTQVLNPTDNKEKSLSDTNKKLKRGLLNRDKTHFKRSDKYDTYMFHFMTLSVIGGFAIMAFILIRNMKPKI